MAEHIKIEPGIWINVKEKLPEDSMIKYDIWDRTTLRRLIEVSWDKKEQKFYHWNNSRVIYYSFDYISHWMIAPEPPKQTKVIDK